MNVPTPQHIANAAVIAAPAVSWQLSLPETVTVAVGVLGGIYYLMLMYDWISKKVRTWKQIVASARSVGQRLKDEEDAVRAAGTDTPPGH